MKECKVYSVNTNLFCNRCKTYVVKNVNKNPGVILGKYTCPCNEVFVPPNGPIPGYYLEPAFPLAVHANKVV